MKVCATLTQAPHIAHLRDVLGDQAYESLVREGEAMTMAAVVAYANDQIDRTELNAVSKLTTTFETVARLSAAHRFGQVVVSQKSASEVHN